MAFRGGNSWNSLRFRIRRRVRRIFSPRVSILLFLGSALVFGTYFKRDEHVQGWLSEITGAIPDSSERSLPRALHGGNAMQRGGQAMGGHAASAGNLPGSRVTYVHDGDTIEVDGLSIRIAALDCAETGSVAGEAATRRMRTLVSAERVTCSLTGERSYDRWIGSCRLANGRDISDVMIGEGLCRRWR